MDVPRGERCVRGVHLLGWVIDGYRSFFWG